MVKKNFGKVFSLGFESGPKLSHMILYLIEGPYLSSTFGTAHPSYRGVLGVKALNLRGYRGLISCIGVEALD